MSSRILLNGTSVMIEMAWEFIAEADVASKSRKKGGVAIKGSNALQFAEGDGENGVSVLAAWVAGQVSNGIVILPLPDQRCWLCGVLAGLVAPETDRIVSHDDLPVTLELLEDMVPDDRHLIKVDTLALPEGEPIAFDALSMPEACASARLLPLAGLEDAPQITGFHRRDTRRIKQMGMAVAAVAITSVAGYMGYNWWNMHQADQQKTEIAAQMQQQAQQARLAARQLADQFRDTHQAMNMYQGVRNALAHFHLEDAGWGLQRVVVNKMVKAEFKRRHGLLADFLEGKEKVTWSKDGGSAELSRDFNGDLPVPLQSYDLQAMNEIQAISLMQKIGDSNMQAGLLTTAPAWAANAPKYSALSGISYIYWKIAVPFSRLQSAMAMLQHANVVVGEVDLNIAGKTCSVEGMIYVSKG